MAVVLETVGLEKHFGGIAAVNGALFVDGAPDDVARDPRVKAVYLGEELGA